MTRFQGHISIPEGVKPGGQFTAMLPNGDTIAVTVPFRAPVDQQMWISVPETPHLFEVTVPVGMAGGMAVVISCPTAGSSKP